LQIFCGVTTMLFSLVLASLLLFGMGNKVGDSIRVCTCQVITACGQMCAWPVHASSDTHDRQPVVVFVQVRGVPSLIYDILYFIFWLACAAALSNLLASFGDFSSRVQASTAFSWLTWCGCCRLSSLLALAYGTAPMHGYVLSIKLLLTWPADPAGFCSLARWCWMFWICEVQALWPTVPPPSTTRQHPTAQLRCPWQPRVLSTAYDDKGWAQACENYEDG
jgi:hypothetical protein